MTSHDAYMKVYMISPDSRALSCMLSRVLVRYVTACDSYAWSLHAPQMAINYFTLCHSTGKILHRLL